MQNVVTETCGCPPATEHRREKPRDCKKPAHDLLDLLFEKRQDTSGRATAPLSQPQIHLALGRVERSWLELPQLLPIPKHPRPYLHPAETHLYFCPLMPSLSLPCPTSPGVASCTNRLPDNLLMQLSNFWMTLSSTINSHARFGRHFYHQCL